MKKLLTVLGVLFILVGCSSGTKDTVCTTKDFEGGAGTITLVKKTKGEDTLKSIVVEGDVSDPDAKLGVTMINSLLSDIGGIDLKIENDKLSASVEFDALDTAKLAELFAMFGGEFGSDDMPSQAELDLMIKMFQGHDFVVQGLESEGFACSVAN
ncbi:hypothetical protein G7062_03425 [Erysipelothrix sp. HDW6C]|uniref:hypothetical protein n=1 Tax=Erysipelothrix sp. HDW6C TaxID=2714930 RepID=UPI0014091187|nr:hypothetical protein [Erysipelothrix sp. HDW6C]QIK69396.1 hypothetical protein G7062_03425 [Erysipelothrix sp. HDW6C]